MKGSLNEVMTLAAKAARGAGAPPAQAAQFGQAAVQHLCAGRPEKELRGALEALPEGPILSLPLLLADADEGFVESEGFEGLARSYVEALPFKASLDADMMLRCDRAVPARRKSPARCRLSNDLMELWCDLAARLLVPESDSSRRSGAGAGLTDND